MVSPELQILTTGFIGRRTELHRLRRRLRGPTRVRAPGPRRAGQVHARPAHGPRPAPRRRRPWPCGAKTPRSMPAGSPRPSSASSWSMAANGSAPAGTRSSGKWTGSRATIRRSGLNASSACSSGTSSAWSSISTTSNRSWSARATTLMAPPIRPRSGGGARRPWRPSGRRWTGSARYGHAPRRCELPLSSR